MPGLGLLSVAALACASAERGATASPPSPRAWVPTWSDEFEGPAGSLVDATKWDFDVGGHGWGNQELQYYTSRSRNAFLNGEGQLVIHALREDFTGPDGVTRAYTSARLKTQGRFQQAYGRFEARLAVPFGQGLWPAFWMLGNDIGSVGWPACGEIDVMENIGREPATVHGTIHGPGYSGAGGLSGSYSLPDAARFADGFQVFAVEWEPAAIRWYVDGRLYHERTPASLAGRRWAFDHPFFVILNVAVGGSWPGEPDATAVFPQTLRVDYVRVYRRG
jgi:beta-glucanase (GH16 family)